MAKAKNMLEMLHDPKVQKRISSLFQRQPSPVGIHPTNSFIDFTLRPDAKFDRRSFRRAYVPSKKHPSHPSLLTLGCEKGHYGKNGTRGGKKYDFLCDQGHMLIHRLDIPTPRVAKTLKRIRKVGLAKVPVPRARRAANRLGQEYPPPAYSNKANPLLLTVNPGLRSNPQVDVTIPFKKGQKINVARFEKWLYENCPDAWIKAYEKAKKQYKKFHLGTMPKNITMEMLPFGDGQLLPPEFVYSAGESPAETYTTDKRSGKAPYSYVHEYKDKPDVLVGGAMGDQFVLKPLRGRARVDDWFRD
jgi:hypothetical protein